MQVHEIDVAQIYTDLRDDRVVLDVRSAEESTGGHVPGAVNVPLPDGAQVSGALNTAGPAPVDLRPPGFADLVGELDGRRNADLPPAEVVLDVRLGTEWDASHVRRAVHVPLPELPDRLDEVPAGSVWVHCGSGYRATAAASLHARAGGSVIVIDDNYGDAEDTGVPLTT